MNAFTSLLFASFAITSMTSVAAESGFNAFELSSACLIKLEKKQLSLRLAQQLTRNTARWQGVFSTYQLEVNVERPCVSEAITNQFDELNRYMRQLQGLIENGPQLYQLRLVDDAMLHQWQQGQLPLVAYAPTGNESTWQYIEAFDHHGNVHLLDVYTQPEVPVLILEVNGQQSLREGLAVMQG
ncbi:hypothetical protein PALB_20510 [Pseudoalteromonas luteoviolacea B = ATCC 29581]|nr:hypothetical protein PALB_20510 [Pseudoalteromonas luteoviolacea B = ATCC 29581]